MSATQLTAAETGRLREWIGRSESRTDEVTRAPVAALAAVLDSEAPAPCVGDTLPPLWHWLYFLPTARQSCLDRDGHPVLGDFLPPVPAFRRMWVGGWLQFHDALHVGDRPERSSRIVDLTYRSGRSGPVTLVTVRHELRNRGTLALTEEQVLAYLASPHQNAAARAAAEAYANPAWAYEIRPDPTLLFRFSALTFNAHRIHYDRQHAQVEGYPALVVHAPLAALLLLESMRRHLPDREVAAFSFRAVKPLFDTAPFSVCGRAESDGSAALWIRDVANDVAMTAAVTLK